MNSRKPKRRNVNVRMKPVAAAVAVAVGTLPGLLIAQDGRESVPILEEIVVTPPGAPPPFRTSRSISLLSPEKSCNSSGLTI